MFFRFAVLTFPRWQAPHGPKWLDKKEAELLFRVENMTCGGCARGVTKAIETLDAAAAVSIDVPGRLVTVHSVRSREEVVSAMVRAGFAAEPLPVDEEKER